MTALTPHMAPDSVPCPLIHADNGAFLLFEGRDTYDYWDGLKLVPMLEATPEEELEAEEAEAGR